MNILDIIIGIILVVFALAGLRKGVIMEAFYLASIVIGIYGAMFFSDAVADWLSDMINVAPEYLALVAFILTFIVFMVLIRFLGNMIAIIVETLCLGFVDKIGGAIFGIIKGALLISVLIMVLNIFNIGDVISKKTRDNSLLYPIVEDITNLLYENHTLVEESMERSFEQGKDFFEQGIEKIEDVIETSLTK